MPCLFSTLTAGKTGKTKAVFVRQTMFMSSDKDAKLFLVFGLGLLLLNFPLLAIFGTEGNILGIPVFFIYILLVWLAIIFLTRKFIRRK